MSYPTVPASIVVSPKDHSVYVGDTVVLSCVTYGLPLPTIIWLKGGQPLLNGSLSESELVTPHVTFVRSILQLCALKLPDQNEYTCQATNALSIANISFALSVKGKHYINNQEYICLISIFFHSSCSPGSSLS